MAMAANAKKTTLLFTMVFTVLVQWLAAQNYPIAGDYIDQSGNRPVFHEKQKWALTNDGNLSPLVQPMMSIMMGCIARP